MSYKYTSFEQTYLFGPGSDGNATITNTQTLSRDTFYNNLTISGAGRINTHGRRLFVRGTLDISGATGICLAANGTNGANATGATAGGGPGNTGPFSIPTNSQAVAGGNGTATNGTASTAFTTVFYCYGGDSVVGGNGGANGVRTGGAAGALTAGNFNSNLGLIQSFWAPSITASWIGGKAGTGGGGGAGDGTNAGGGGGSSATGGCILWVQANKIITSSANNIVGAIQANGANGGNGAAGVAGNASGGGGGSGSGGGLVYIVYYFLGGSFKTDIISVDGGAGGNGGNGVGTGLGGNSGGAGGSGQYILVDATTGQVRQSGGGTAGVAGNAASGGTGGTGPSGVQLRVTL